MEGGVEGDEVKEDEGHSLSPVTTNSMHNALTPVNQKVA